MEKLSASKKELLIKVLSGTGKGVKMTGRGIKNLALYGPEAAIGSATVGAKGAIAGGGIGAILAAAIKENPAIADLIYPAGAGAAIGGILGSLRGGANAVIKRKKKFQGPILRLVHQ